jgi:hypothetical protein
MSSCWCAASRCSTRPGRVTGRRAAGARRHRGAQARPAAAVEGRHDPRDPPPGEEQPADDLLAAAPAGAKVARPSAKAAIAESVRRIRTIALVHETLSREVGDDVAFREIVRPLVRWSEEGLVSPDRPVGSPCRATAARLPSAIATPLAVVLTELLQNAVDHAFPEGRARGSGGRGRRGARRDDHGVCITMVDNGVGVPDGFERRIGVVAGPVHRATRSLPPNCVARSRSGAEAPRYHDQEPVSRFACRPADQPTGEGAGRSVRSRCGGAGQALRRCAASVRTAELAALLLGGAAPDARVLVGGDGELEARRSWRRTAADGLGVVDLLDRRTGGAHREEQVRIGVATGGGAAPFVGLRW